MVISFHFFIKTILIQQSGIILIHTQIQSIVDSTRIGLSLIYDVEINRILGEKGHGPRVDILANSAPRRRRRWGKK